MAQALQQAARMRVAIAIGLVMALSQSVSAEPDEGYGYQIAIADSGSLVILAGASYVPGVSFETAAGLSVGTYLFGGAIVHAVHREPDRAAASVGLRIALPLVGLLAGDLVQQATSGGDPHPWEEFDGPPSPWWLLGGLGGLVAASVIDATYLAGGYHKPEPTQWTPTASASSNGVALGIGRAF